MPGKHRTLSGFPSIDKPWLKYYSSEAVNSEMPHGSMYDYLYANNADHLDETALDYFSKKITLQELSRLENLVRAFSVLLLL